MQWRFGPFRLDLEHACLWQDTQRLPLRPKTFDLLVYLVKHAGELVSKEALLEAVWPDTAITEGVLTTSMGELRKVLGETARQPQFIVTVHRRGYRFIAPVTVVERPAISTAAAAPLQDRGHPCPVLVDREAELGQLHQVLMAALQGQRQMVLVAGEAGIGKTALVDAFVAQIGPQAHLWIGRGQCIDHYGAGEAYLPLLEALRQVASAADGTRVMETLRQHAPSWLLQLPALVSSQEVQALQQRALGATRERMLRELAEAVEILTQARPVILLLEDLHWGDLSTLDWLAYVARRRTAARLLVLGTYRPVDAVVREHPIRAITQELRVHGQCQELPLAYLSETGVAAYLAQRFGQIPLSNDFIRTVYRRTNGNPLFLVTVVDEILRHSPPQTDAAGGKRLSPAPEATVVDIPESLRLLIDQQLAHLGPEERTSLDAASVAGREFSAAAVAAGLDTAVEEVEAQYETFARRGQFVQACGTDVWPDGTIAARYGFIHDLYHEFLYEQVPVSRRARWHRQIGVRLEAGYGARAQEMAAELAVHFMRGRASAKALQYLQYAGENALQRHANQEAIMHLTQALAILPSLPDTPARDQQELTLRQTLGVPLVATKGYATPEVEQTYSRAYTLCQQVGDTHQMRSVLLGLWRVYSMRGKLKTAQAVAEQLLDLAQRGDDPCQLVEAHRAMGVVLSWLGDLTAACRHLEQGAALYDRQQPACHAHHSGPNVGVSCLSMVAIPLWMLGYPDRATVRSEQAIALAQELHHPFSLAFALINTARLHHFRREWQMVQKRAEAVQKLATQHNFAFWQAVGTRWQGVALAAQGQTEAGMALIRQGHTAYQSTGTLTSEPYYRLLWAEAYSDAGQTERGVEMMRKALAAFANAEDRLYEAEVYRLKGKLLLACKTTPRSEVEGCFRQALAVARRQKAKSLELRAAMSLVQLGQQRGDRNALADVYQGFTEGFNTADLQEAKALLEVRKGDSKA